jgi:hypothetical protein
MPPPITPRRKQPFIGAKALEKVAALEPTCRIAWRGVITEIIRITG